MPVDFAAVAARFAESFAGQLRTQPLLQRLIATALTRRLLADRTVEYATAGFPAVAFRDGAVSLVLSRATAGTLTPLAPPRSPGATLADAGWAFLDGLAHAVAPFGEDNQEGAIWRLAAGLDGALTDIEATVRRSATPTPAMFDPAGHRAGELFGVAALGWTAAVAASRPGAGADQLLGQVAAARAAFPAGPDDGGAATAADRLDDLALTLLAGFGVLATLPWLVDHLVDGARTALHAGALEQLGHLEAVGLGLRTEALATLFLGLTDHAVYLVAAANELLTDQITDRTTFWWHYGAQLLRRVRTFVEELGGFLGDVGNLLQAVPGWLGHLVAFRIRITEFDLLGEHIVIGIHLGDVLDEAGTSVNATRRYQLLATIMLVEQAVGVGYHTIKAREAVLALFAGGGPGDRIPELPGAAPLEFRSDFPQLVDTALGGGRRAELFAILDRAEAGVRAGLGAALTGVSRGLAAASAYHTRTAADAARSLPAAGLERVAEQAQARALALFADVATPRHHPGALARQLEARLAGGGIALVGAVVDRWVGDLAAFWRARITEGTELPDPLIPTSPLILRRRAQLARVALPRLTVRVAGELPLDDELAAAVAARFADAVRDAHRAGRRRLAELAELGGP